MGYWADFIDPCSGLPMMTLGCNKVGVSLSVNESLVFVADSIHFSSLPGVFRSRFDGMLVKLQVI